MDKRRWITREEIAEIHETMADNAAAEANAAMRVHEYGAAGNHMDHALGHQEAARDIRATDQLLSPALRRVR